VNTRKVTLDEWAVSNYATPPHRNTLQRWARHGCIYPPPKKEGRAYYVLPDAKYIDPTAPTSELVKRLYGT